MVLLNQADENKVEVVFVAHEVFVVATNAAMVGTELAGEVVEVQVVAMPDEVEGDMPFIVKVAQASIVSFANRITTLVFPTKAGELEEVERYGST